jgi:hypothetical protein
LFHTFIDALEKVARFDRAVNSKDFKVGEVEGPNGGTQIALQIPGGEVFPLEEHAENQLLSQWAVPPPHFRRLPREIQAAELNHFSRRYPKELTLRAVQEEGVQGPTARAVVSQHYTPFDSAEVLRLAEPMLEGFQIQNPIVNRDQMRLVLTTPREHDVSKRKIGDIVKTGLTLRNGEVGDMAAAVEFTIWRLRCLNGAMVETPEVTLRQRHAWLDAQSFAIQLRNAIGNVSAIGERYVQLLEGTHDLRLPNLDPDEGRLQRTVIGMLRKDGIWTKPFEKEALEVLGTKEEASVFGLIQFVTDKAKALPVVERLAWERSAGRLMQLAA